MPDTIDFDSYFDAWREDLELLRQNQLLSESSFLTFAKDRGGKAIGLITGEPSEFHKSGWLKNDGVDEEGRLYFHPFRIYPLDRVLDRIAARRWSFKNLQMAAVKELTDCAREWNDFTDLAILLEPIHWPDMTGHILGLNESQYRKHIARYQDLAYELIRTLDVELWRKRHESMRINAGRIDKNSELYLLLRLSNWEKRKKLEGAVSRALWFRHMGEVVRRSFEAVFPERWLEEDQAFGHWMTGGRRREFGSERPLDDELRSKPYLAYGFGLFTGSAIRWYLEGETEYYAVLEMLPDPHRFAIELVNLAGGIKSGQNNTALKLEAMLKEDKALRRFSQISFDDDVPANRKAIQNQVRRRNVVGAVWNHMPDFEFANFAIAELVDVVAEMDAANGFSDGKLRKMDWTNVRGAGDFEQIYKATSDAKPRGLKGEKWGRALASYADDHPRRSDTGEIRPLLEEIRAALHGRMSNYDWSKEVFEIDPNTFKQVRRGRSD